MVEYLHIENLDKKYDTKKVLDSFTLDLELRKVATFVGVNGSGKTTLLRILAGLDKPTSGTIRMHEAFLDTNELRRKSTMVFQRTAMFNTNVHNNVAFGLRAKGLRREETEKRVAQALDTVGLAGFQKRKAKKISGGEQQRVALARAFVLRPEILLLDEPTANLDPANATIIENVINHMRARKQCTIILATHNLFQARRLSDLIVHIHSGKIVESTNPSNFFEHPTNEITRKFVNGEIQF